MKKLLLVLGVALALAMFGGCQKAATPPAGGSDELTNVTGDDVSASETKATEESAATTPADAQTTG
jgi:hypothetical protein